MNRRITGAGMPAGTGANPAGSSGGIRIFIWPARPRLNKPLNKSPKPADHLNIL